MGGEGRVEGGGTMNVAPAAPGKEARGVLLVFHRPTFFANPVDASNVDENIAAFERHSRFPVWGLNTNIPIPPGVHDLRFEAIFLHYSVFINTPTGYLIPDPLLDYIRDSGAYKLASFQDEYHHCAKRFAFIDEVGIDCVYTMLEKPHADEVYAKRTSASRVIPNLPAYVGAELLETADRFAKPDAERTIDVGYRGRPMPAYMGRGAQEKREIGQLFADRAAASELRIDIGVREEDRIYGEAWPRFIAECRGTLGVESGVSCFDLEDEVLAEYERLSAGGREPTLEELERGALGRWDWKIPYQTLSPRNLEAAALEVCQILYEGRYSGLMEPMVHYIPLRKDFSNFDEVIERFRDEDLRRELTGNARRDLVDSGELGYERLVEGLDAVLGDADLRPDSSKREVARVSRSLRRPLRDIVWQRVHYLYVNHRRAWRWLWVASRPLFAASRFARRLAGREPRRGP
jgi:hypothetical protein